MELDVPTARPSWLRRILQVSNYDFCPWANRYVYWLKRPIGWFLIGIASSVLLGLHVSAKALLVAAALSIVAAIGLSWPLIAFFGIQSRLRWERLRCEEGDEVDVILTIANRWPFPVWGLVLRGDDITTRRKGHEHVPVAVSRVPGLSRNEFRWRSIASKRGVYPDGELVLSTSFPFGLFTTNKPVLIDRSVIVWPKTFRLLDAPIISGRQRAATGASCSQVGHDGDWSGFRPFREGDSLRNVHWAQSARRDDLIVCERESCSKERVLISLPEGAEATCRSVDQREWMIRVLASLVRQFLSHSWEVEVHMGAAIDKYPNGMSSFPKWLDRIAAYRWSTASLSDEVVTEDLVAESIAIDRLARRPLRDPHLYRIRLSNTAFEQKQAPRNPHARTELLILIDHPNDSAQLRPTGATANSSAYSSVVRLIAEPSLPEQIQRYWQRFCQHSVAS